jgi:hypothetical protein
MTRFTNRADDVGDDVNATLELLGDEDPLSVITAIASSSTATNSTIPMASMSRDPDWKKATAHIARAEATQAMRCRYAFVDAPPTRLIDLPDNPAP